MPDLFSIMRKFAKPTRDGARLGDLIKRFEDVRQLVRRDADTAIHTVDPNSVAAPTGVDRPSALIGVTDNDVGGVRRAQPRWLPPQDIGYRPRLID
jgi:hypothetical protein